MPARGFKREVSERTLRPIAKALVDDVMPSFVDASLGNAKVYLLHYPRGATHLVNAIDYAYEKMLSSFGVRKPYERLNMPISTENIVHPALVKQITEEHIAAVKPRSVLIYVDEMVSGRNSLGVMESIYETAVRKKKCKLVAHLFVSSGGKYLDKNALQDMRRLERKGVEIHEHIMPFDLPWTDSVKHLGYQWGLMHQFPRAKLEKAGVESYLMHPLEQEFKKIYLQHLYRGRAPSFKILTHDSPQYKLRDRYFADALEAALKKYHVHDVMEVKRTKETGLSVNGVPVYAEPLAEHLFDAHPLTFLVGVEKQGRLGDVYAHFLESDNRTLVDVRSKAPESRELSRMLNKQVGAEVHENMRALNKAIKRAGMHAAKVVLEQ